MLQEARFSSSSLGNPGKWEATGSKEPGYEEKDRKVHSSRWDGPDCTSQCRGKCDERRSFLRLQRRD